MFDTLGGNRRLKSSRSSKAHHGRPRRAGVVVVHATPFGAQQFDEPLTVLVLVYGCQRISNMFGWDSFLSQLVGDFHASPSIKGEFVFNEGLGISLVVYKALFNELTQHLVGIPGSQAPLDQLRSNVARRLLAAGAHGCGAVKCLGWGEGLLGFIHLLAVGRCRSSEPGIA